MVNNFKNCSEVAILKTNHFRIMKLPLGIVFLLVLWGLKFSIGNIQHTANSTRFPQKPISIPPKLNSIQYVVWEHFTNRKGGIWTLNKGSTTEVQLLFPEYAIEDDIKITCYIVEIHGSLPVLDIYATNLKTGQHVKFFSKYIELRYNNVPDELARTVGMIVDREPIPKDNGSECFYKVDGNRVAVHTRHFSLIEPDCGDQDHKYDSPIIVNIYRRDTHSSIEFKLFLTTVEFNGERPINDPGYMYVNSFTLHDEHLPATIMKSTTFWADIEANTCTWKAKSNSLGSQARQLGHRLRCPFHSNVVIAEAVILSLNRAQVSYPIVFEGSLTIQLGNATAYCYQVKVSKEWNWSTLALTIGLAIAVLLFIVFPLTIKFYQCCFKERAINGLQYIAWKLKMYKPLDKLQDEVRNLTDKKVNYFCGKVTTKTNLHKIAAELGIEADVVHTAITDNSTSITEATRQVIHAWLSDEKNREVAFDKMYTALCKVGLVFIAYAIAKYNDKNQITTKIVEGSKKPHVQESTQ